MLANLSNTGKAFVYYTIAFLLCCGVALSSPRLGPQTLPVASFTPLAAVALTLFLTRDSWASLGLQRAGWSGWPLALGLPVAILGVSYGTLWITGAARFVTFDGIEPTAFVLDLVASLAFVTITTGIGEEIGWRGYMLPRLLAFGPRRACLLTGLMHGVFHLPVLFGTPYYHAAGNGWITVPLFLLTLTLAGVCYGYLRIATGSVWPVAVAHSVFNIVWDRLNAFTAFDSPFANEYLAGESGVLTIGSLAVVALLLGRYRLAR